MCIASHAAASCSFACAVQYKLTYSECSPEDFSGYNISVYLNSEIAPFKGHNIRHFQEDYLVAVCVGHSTLLVILQYAIVISFDKQLQATAQSEVTS